MCVCRIFQLSINPSYSYKLVKGEGSAIKYNSAVNENLVQSLRSASKIIIEVVENRKSMILHIASCVKRIAKHVIRPARY